MASRRVLVFDNDSSFLEFLKNSLGAYGFEVYEATADLNDIQRLKAFNPEVIVIAVDLPDKAGFALCSKARRAVGKNIPIVLVTATLLSQDMGLHGKQTLHADIYLDKRSLSRDEFLRKLDAVTGPGTRIGPLPQEDDRGLRHANDTNHISAGEDESVLPKGAAAEAHETAGAAGQEELTGGQPASIPEALEETKKDKSDASLAASDQTDVMDEKITRKDADGFSDLNRRLAEREGEILRLRSQLEETRRDASSSAVKQAEREKQAALESIQQQMKEEAAKSDEKRSHDLKALEEKFSARIAQLLSEKKGEIETLKQKMNEQVRKTADMLTKEQEAHQETRRHLESRIAGLEDKHAAAMKQAEREKQSALGSVQQQMEKETARADDKRKEAGSEDIRVPPGEAKSVIAAKPPPAMGKKMLISGAIGLILGIVITSIVFFLAQGEGKSSSGEEKKALQQIQSQPDTKPATTPTPPARKADKPPGQPQKAAEAKPQKQEKETIESREKAAAKKESAKKEAAQKSEKKKSEEGEKKKKKKKKKELKQVPSMEPKFVE